MIIKTVIQAWWWDIDLSMLWLIYIFLFNLGLNAKQDREDDGNNDHMSRIVCVWLRLVLTLWNFTSFFLFFFLYPNGRMASPFISSSFPSFPPSTLFTSSHNKMQANLSWLCFNQFLFFSSPLAKWPMLFASFFSFFLQRVQHA